MKKNRILTALTVAVVVLLLTTPVYAKKKPVLNKKTVTIKVGKTTKLKVRRAKEPITWSSSNESVAVVTSQGRVTGIASGKANIYASVSGKVLKCRVIVKQNKGKKDKGIYHTEKGKTRYKSIPPFSVKISISGDKLYVEGTLQKTVNGKDYAAVSGVRHVFVLSSNTKYWEGFFNTDENDYTQEMFLSNAERSVGGKELILSVDIKGGKVYEVGIAPFTKHWNFSFRDI